MKIINIKFVCKNCGIDIEKDTVSSSEQWDVYLNKCPECGGKTKIVIEKEVKE